MMKLLVFLILIFDQLLTVSCAKKLHECTLFIQDYSPGDPELVCECNDPTKQNKRLVSIQGAPDKLWEMFDDGEIQSSVDVLIAKGATCDDKTFIIPNEKKVTIYQPPPDTAGKLPTVGTRDVLVLRVSARTGDRITNTPTHSRDKLINDIFGDGKVSLRNQFNLCSIGQLEMAPVESSDVSDGVYDVTVDVVSDNKRMDYANDAIAAAGAILGSLESYHHVMVCLPPDLSYSDVSGSWIAFAPVNGYKSIYNDEWCHYVSASMHEIGHNLNLAHSMEGFDEYGDNSGMVCVQYALYHIPILSVCDQLKIHIALSLSVAYV